MKNRVTLRDVAHQAGVHFTTVSMALRNHPQIPQSTRQRIQALATQMEYRPDSLLSALSSYRSCRKQCATLAWLNNYRKQDWLRRHPLFGEYFTGAQSRASELGFQLEDFWLDEKNITYKRFHTILRTRNICGVLIPPQQFEVYPLNLRWKELSAVTFGHSLREPQLHSVVPDQYRGMSIVLKNLRLLGYKRIGLYLDPSLDYRGEHHWLGAYWVDYHSQSRAHRVPPLITKASHNQISFEKWCLSTRPEAIVIVGDAYRAVKTPFRIKLAFHCVHTNEPHKTGFNENGYMTGRMATELLVDMLTRREIGIPDYPRRVLVPGFWQPGYVKSIHS